MPGTTLDWNLPYPLGTDPVRDGENVIQSLAEAIDSYLTYVNEVSGLTGEDSAVALLVTTPTSDTAQALSDTFAPLAALRNVYTGKAEYNGGFTNSYDTDLWIAGAVRSNPLNNSQGMYIQHRVVGDLGGLVHDAGASELRLAAASNSGAGQNAFETSLVITGGANTLGSLNGVTSNFHIEGGATGTVTSVALYRAQTVPALGGVTASKVYGIYAEPQTVGTVENWSIYAPGGQSLFNTIVLDAGVSSSRAVQIKTSGVLRWIIGASAAAESGSNVGSDFQINARTDSGASNFIPFSIARGSGLTSINNGLKVTGNLGFYGTTPVAKPSVSGSRAGNAALTSLLAALASQGLITDGSTA